VGVTRNEPTTACIDIIIVIIISMMISISHS